MEKKDILKIIVLIGVAVMVGSMFAPSLMFNSSNGTPGQTGELVTGMAVFNGTIRTYDPFIYVQNLPDSVLNEVRLDERVRSVTPDSGGYFINTTTRDDVYPLAQYLKKKGVSPQSVANIILPASLEMELSNGTRIELTSVGAVRVVTEPLVDSDTEVLVQMIATARNGRLESPVSAQILAEAVSVSGNATVSSFEGREYVYTIPWDSRLEIDDSSIPGNVDFERNDYISFASPLSVMQISEKKDLEYITFISDTGASVTENFTDKERIISDFGDISVVFPDSSLKIATNETVSLPYNGTALLMYSVEVPPSIGGYSLDGKTIDIKVENEYSLNQSVDIIVNGTAIGNRIVEIEGIQVG